MKESEGMKVLLLSPLPPPAGGIATWTEEYCRFVESAEHSVRVINTALVGKRASGKREKRLTEELHRSWKILRQMGKALREESFDYVHINSACSPEGLLRDVACLLLARKNPAILHCHCNVEDQIGKSRLGKLLLTYAAKKASLVLVLNERSRQALRALGCQTAELLPNFIAQEAIAPAPQITECARRILYVGHVRKEKGLFELLEAARALPEMEFRLLGPIYEELTGIEIPENVCLLGMKPKQEVPSFLEQADIFLFPSYSEGFSLALLEAMAAGLPCIATDVGANRDMLEDQGGILIPVADAKAIVDGVKKLQDATLRNHMSAWNQKKVRETYTVGQVMTCLLDRMREF